VGFIRQINVFFYPVIYPSTYLEKYGDILSFQPAYLGEIIKLLGQSYMDTSKIGFHGDLP